MDLSELTIHEAHEKLKNKEISAKDLAGAGFGDATVRLELPIEGEPVASFEFRVSVVDDACAHFGEANTLVPHRCG